MTVLKKGKHRKQIGILKAFDAASNEGRVLLTGCGEGGKDLMLELEFGQFSKKDGDNN